MKVTYNSPSALSSIAFFSIGVVFSLLTLIYFLGALIDGGGPNYNQGLSILGKIWFVELLAYAVSAFYLVANYHQLISRQRRLTFLVYYWTPFLISLLITPIIWIASNGCALVTPCSQGKTASVVVMASRLSNVR